VNGHNEIVERPASAGKPVVCVSKAEESQLKYVVAIILKPSRKASLTRDPPTDGGQTPPAPLAELLTPTAATEVVLQFKHFAPPGVKEWLVHVQGYVKRRLAMSPSVV
jgi:hypothetical protein